MSFWTRQSFIVLITLLVTGYIFNFTSIPSEVISNQLEYDKNANMQELEIYLFIFSFMLFYFITALGFSPHRIDNKKILELQGKMTVPEIRNF